MSKTISFKGTIAIGLQDKLNLATLNGKTGYRITRLKVFPTNPGANNEILLQAFSKDQSGSISATVDFSSSDLLGVAYWKEGHDYNHGFWTDLFFDNEVFNQNIYLTMTDAGSGGSTPGNYFIELETVALSDTQSTQLTLKNLRTIASR